MAITTFNNPTDFQVKINEANSVLNLPTTYFDNVVGLLCLILKPNQVDGKSSLQIPANDIKDFFPIIMRSEYFNFWKYELDAVVNGIPGKIILRPKLVPTGPGYEYIQMMFEGSCHELKRGMAANDRLIFILKKGSPIYEMFNIPSASNPFGIIQEFIAIKRDSEITTFKLPPIAIDKKDIKHPFNQILYGPPGTGKTHNAIYHALSIIKNYDLNIMIEKEKTTPGFREQIKEEFDELIENGQVQFVTFHQSYSYEEFIEGIKPSVNGNNVQYSIEDGIFKKLCLTAQKLLTYDFEDIYDDFTNELIKDKEIKLKTAVQKKDFTVKLNNSEDICAITSKGKSVSISEKAVFDYFKNGDIPLWHDGSYVRAIGDYLKDKYSTKIKSVDNSDKNFVLIIDEINRGNISKIFGELITLIEDSKRNGGSEKLEAFLPYSQKPFSVPSNVFIIGTMNSADRSIALIDTALRRRFTFIGYSSDSDLLSDNIESINMKLMLRKLNERIEFLLDKDHLLGHAYFLDVKTKNDLCGVFRNKILPLLEEYFFGNYEKIQQVLGDNSGWKKIEEQKLIQEKKGNTTTALFGNTEDFEDKIIYQINPKLISGKFDEINADVFTSIYTKQ